MGWLKVIFIIGLSFVPVIGQIMWAYYLLKIGWKYIEMCIKVDFWTIYLIVSVFTQLPIYLLIIRPGIAGAHLFERFLGGVHSGVEVLHSKPKYAGGLIALFGVIIFSFAPVPISIQDMSVDTLLSNAQSFGIILGSSTFVTIVLAALANKFYSGDLKTGSSEKEPSLDPMYGPSGAGKAKEAAREGMRGMYESKEAAHEVAETTEKVTGKKPWVPENMTKAASKLKGSIPFMDSKSATKKAGKRAGKASRAGKAGKAAKAGKTAKAGKAVAGAGAALGGWEAVIALLVALILGLIIFVVQFVAVMAIAGGIFYAYLPLLSGVFGDALGFGIDYGNYGSQILAPYIPSIDMQPLVMAVQGPIAKAQCALEGPSCFSEWQMNNTERPGSEAVGQEYDLTVDGFEVANGQTIDVAYNNPGQALSVSFALNNPRNGLRGIEANNVRYNLSVNRNNGASLCNTGFKSIDLYTGGGREPDTILPGDSWAFRSNEAVRQDITLRNCNLLQPGQIELTREAELQVKYEYGSQSNLDIRAMSYDNLDQQDMDRSFKESETADTPVKSYINAYAPVLFDEYEDGERNARPFDVQVGLKTDRTDIKYRVDPDSIRFTPSTATEIAAPSRCDFVPVEGTEDELVTTYKLEQSAIDQINRESFESDSWYDSTRGPTVMECPLQIANPEDISSSGETLIMDVNADYTVIKEDVTYDFQTWNTLCSGRNCPFLVTQQDKQQLSDPENFLSTCSPSKRADASGGCDVRKLAEDLEGWQNPSEDELHFNYETIGRGQTAYRWDTADVIGGQAAHKSSIPNPDRPAIGVSEEDWVQITGPIPEDEEQDSIIVAVRNRDGESRDVDVEYLDQTVLCRQESTYSTSNIVKGFANIWAERNIAEDILYTRVDEVRDNCQPSEGFLESVGSALGMESAQDRYNDVAENCNSIMAIRNGNFACYEDY